MLWKGGYAVLKVVIADDEARILSLIRLLPDWDALGIEVAGTAGNGYPHHRHPHAGLPGA